MRPKLVAKFPKLFANQAMMEMIRSWRIVSFATWSAAVIFVGLLTGAMAVMLPPMASIGVVALVGVVLLWAMPDLRIVPEKQLRTMFFIMVAVQLCVPVYYAIDIGYLPWISVRRFFSLAVIVLFALTVAGSQSARHEIADTVRDNRPLAYCAFGFLLTMFLSILTSVNVSHSMAGFFDTLLNWYIPFLACILVVRSEQDTILLAKIIVVSTAIVAIAGVFEFVLERRYFFDVFPRSLLDDMLARNPALAAMYNVSMFRNGLYRAASIFSVSLSFSEFLAMTAPISAYFILHSANWRPRLLGVVTMILIVVGLLVSGARGGYLSFVVAMPMMIVFWTIRYTKLNPSSMASAIVFCIFLAGAMMLVGLVLSSGRLTALVLGDAETAASTESRFIQWNLATPHILSNPITGHGVGNSGDLVGYATETGVPSVDSYIITLLVEQGVPSLFLFFGMVAIGIWIGLRIYLTDPSKNAELAGPLACSLVAFGVYRIVLSQRENHTLLFLLIGLILVVGKLANDQRHRSRKELERPRRFQ